MTRRAKIVCTMGPATSSEEGIAALLDAGMNVARMNFSHGDHDDHRVIYHRLRTAAGTAGKPSPSWPTCRDPRSDSAGSPTDPRMAHR